MKRLMWMLAAAMVVMGVVRGASAQPRVWLEDASEFPAHRLVQNGKIRAAVPFRLSQFPDYRASTILARETVYTDPHGMVREIARGIADSCGIDGEALLKVIYPGGAYWYVPDIGGSVINKAGFIDAIAAGNFNVFADRSDVVTLSVIRDELLAALDKQYAGVRPTMAFHDLEIGTGYTADLLADPRVAARVDAMVAVDAAAGRTLARETAVYVLIVEAIEATVHHVWDPIFPGMRHFIWFGVNMARPHADLGIWGVPGCSNLRASCFPDYDNGAAGAGSLLTVINGAKPDVPLLVLLTTIYDPSDFERKVVVCRDRGVTDILLFTQYGFQIDAAERGLDLAAARPMPVPVLRGAWFDGTTLVTRFSRSVEDGRMPIGQMAMSSRGARFVDGGRPGRAKVIGAAGASGGGRSGDTFLWPMLGVSSPARAGEHTVTIGAGTVRAAGGVGCDRIVNYPVRFGAYSLAALWAYPPELREYLLKLLFKE